MEEFWPTWWDRADAWVNSYSGIQYTQITPIAGADSVILPTRMWQNFVNYKKPNWAEPQFVFLITIFWRDLIIHWRHDNRHHHLQQRVDGAQVGRHLSKKVEYSEHSRGNKEEWVSSKAKRNLWTWKQEITFKDGFSLILTAFCLISLTNNYSHAYIYKTRKWCEVHTEQHMEDKKKDAYQHAHSPCSMWREKLHFPLFDKALEIPKLKFMEPRA
jgi:hypothetical protein